LPFFPSGFRSFPYYFLSSHSSFSPIFSSLLPSYISINTLVTISSCTSVPQPAFRGTSLGVLREVME
jgi:hypothetical protein